MGKTCLAGVVSGTRKTERGEPYGIVEALDGKAYALDIDMSSTEPMALHLGDLIRFTPGGLGNGLATNVELTAFRCQASPDGNLGSVRHRVSHLSDLAVADGPEAKVWETDDADIRAWIAHKTERSGN